MNDDIEQTWAAGGAAEEDDELCAYRALQIDFAEIDARHKRLKWSDDFEEDGNRGDEAQEATHRPAWQGRIYEANDGNGNEDWGEDAQGFEEEQEQGATQGGEQQEWVYD